MLMKVAPEGMLKFVPMLQDMSAGHVDWLVNSAVYRKDYAALAMMSKSQMILTRSGQNDVIDLAPAALNFRFQIQFQIQFHFAILQIADFQTTSRK